MSKAMSGWAVGLGKSGMLVLMAAVAVAAGVALATCNVHDPFGDAVAAGVPSTPLTDGGTGDARGPGWLDGVPDEAGGEITPVAGDGSKALLSFGFERAGASTGSADGGPSRSVAGASSDDIFDSLCNVYQLTLVDEAWPDKVWEFDEKVGPAANLAAAVGTGRTYHILILWGHVDDEEAYKAGEGEAPTLLASGYLKHTVRDYGLVVRVPVRALVADVQFVPVSGDVRQTGRLARTVGLDAGTTYKMRVTLGEAQSGSAFIDDALRTATGDGLAPLRQAEDAVADATGVNLPGLDTIVNEGKYGATTLRAYATSDPSVYEYGSFSPAGVGSTTTAYFTMKLAPFGLKDAAAWEWSDDFHTAPLRLPTWIVRNGLNDDPQTAAVYNADGTVISYGTDFARYGAESSANPNGAIRIGVVNPAAPFSAGLFEDNNPWPIKGTEDKTSAQIDAWLDAYLAVECPVTGGMGKEGRGKYGVYTRYPGGMPVGDNPPGTGPAPSINLNPFDFGSSVEWAAQEGSASGLDGSLAGPSLAALQGNRANLVTYAELIVLRKGNHAIVGFYPLNGSNKIDISGLRYDVPYGFLLLAGYKSDADKTLLASGYQEKALSSGDGALGKFSLTPLVIETALVKSADVNRYVGRVARTVGLDQSASYQLKAHIGSWDVGVAASDDPLRHAGGDGLKPLRQAQQAATGASSLPGSLALAANKANYGSDIVKGATTTGIEQYSFSTVGASDTTGKIYFNLVYAPFGKTDAADWTAVGESSAPTWVIRNGLNDTPQTQADYNIATGNRSVDGTNFTVYRTGHTEWTGTWVADYPTADINGAISIGVVNPAAVPSTTGLFEENNPWPVGGPGLYWQNDGRASGAADHPTLQASLVHLNGGLGLNMTGANGGAKYGRYDIRIRGETGAKGLYYGDIRNIHENGAVSLSITGLLNGATRPTVYLTSEGNLLAFGGGAIAVTMKDLVLRGLYEGKNDAGFQSGLTNNGNESLLFVDGASVELSAENVDVLYNSRTTVIFDLQAGGGVSVEGGAKITWKSGDIKGNRMKSDSFVGGGGVYVSGGTFIMDGGDITENACEGGYDRNGCGVLAVEGGKFILYQGGVYNNTGGDNLRWIGNIDGDVENLTGPGYGYWPAGTRGWILAWDATWAPASQTPYTDGKPSVLIPGLGVNGVAMPAYDEGLGGNAVYAARP